MMKRLVLYNSIILATGILILWLWVPDSQAQSTQGTTASHTTAGDPSLGKELYGARCAMCHGNEGKGDGVTASLLHPRPRDFTSGKYKIRSTESGSIPTDADMERSIREGLHSTAMPGWQEFIAGDSLKALISYLKSFSSRFQSEQPKPFKLAAEIPATSASVDAGKQVFQKLQCYSCHGTDGTGKDAVAADLKDDWGNDLVATNLTEPWTFRGGGSAADIFLRFRSGMDGTPMPSFVGSASDKEMWDLAHYVVSLGRKPLAAMNEQEVIDHFGTMAQRAKEHPVERGKYIVYAYGCGDCHSPFSGDGKLMEQYRFAGGMRWTLGPYGEVTTPNLTPDKETGLGSWTDEEIKRGITKGIRKDGSRAVPFPMPWTSYANLSDDDLNAVVAYLRSLPPVYNEIPQPQSLELFPYLWAKFKMLILREDFAMTVTTGNAGVAKQESATGQAGNGKETTK